MTSYGQRIGAAARGFGQQLPLREAATTLGAAMGDNAPSVIIERERERESMESYGMSAEMGNKNNYAIQSGYSPSISVKHHAACIITESDLAAMRYIVRRLTPMECERLQGLPDRWTIPAFRPDEIIDALVEEFVDIHDTFNRIMAEYAGAKPPKPKTAKQIRKWLEKISNPATCPDAPRYKACGNGWATNQPRWILLRLIDEDRKAGVE